MNKFCTNCGAPLASQRPDRTPLRIAIVVGALVLGLPLLVFLCLQSTLSARFSTSARLSSEANLAAASINYTASYAQDLESALETDTGDDLVVSLIEAYTDHPCEMSCDGSCLYDDYSDFRLVLSFSVDNPADPSLSFVLDDSIELEGDWYNNYPNPTENHRYTYQLENYLKKRARSSEASSSGADSSVLDSDSADAPVPSLPDEVYIKTSPNDTPEANA